MPFIPFSPFRLCLFLAVSLGRLRFRVFHVLSACLKLCASLRVFFTELLLFMFAELATGDENQPGHVGNICESAARREKPAFVYLPSEIKDLLFKRMNGPSAGSPTLAL